MANPAVSQRTYLIPIDDMTLAERQSRRAQADDQAVDAALKLALAPEERGLVVRDCEPGFDLGIGLVVAAPLFSQDYLIAGPGVAGTELQYVGQNLAGIDKTISFVGLGVGDPAGGAAAITPISLVRMTQGAASAQTLAIYQVEQLVLRQTPWGYFAKPITYSKGQFIRIMVTPRVAFGANGARLPFNARVCEPLSTLGFIPVV